MCRRSAAHSLFVDFSYKGRCGQLIFLQKCGKIRYLIPTGGIHSTSHYGAARLKKGGTRSAVTGGAAVWRPVARRAG